MAEIRKKYKDQRAQAEAMQTLYKEYGINPVGGCLPLLVQMPVLFGLFYALSAVLRSAKTVQDINKLLYPFVPAFHHFPNIDLNWFTFINASWHFSLGTPDPTHILPILAAVATFLQLRMSQPKNATGASDAMSQQMKIMQLISPVMVLFFGWSYAAGLALYWTISSLFAMVQQYFVTGWGSLLVTPDFLTSKGNNNAKGNNKGKSYTGDRAKETKLLAKGEEPDNVVESGPVGRKLQTNSYGNGSSPARRRSASARRRSSNNIPKRNASRT
jgi:YidC/Oxa1 family membrane protein insertase